MFIGTYDVLRFKNYVEWTYCTPVGNKETEEHTNLDDEYYGVGVWFLTSTFFLHYRFTTILIEGIMACLKSFWS